MSFSPSQFILSLFCFSLCIGAFDYFRGNKWRLGERFQAGLQTFEPLVLTMAGILVLIPLFSVVLVPVLTPLTAFLGADPAMFAGTLLANDMGAFQLAHSLTGDTNAGDFCGMLLGAVMGVNFVFTLPAALKLLRPEDHAFFFKGLLYGFATLPLGGLAGGLCAGYPMAWLLHQLVPVLLVSVLSILLLWLLPQAFARILGRLGRCIEVLALAGLVAAIVMELCNLELGTTLQLSSIGDALKTICSIVIVLPGAYVTIELANRGFRPLLARIGGILGVNNFSVLGCLTTLANDIPTFQMFKQMDDKGKILNSAFLTAGAFTLGDHLAFCCALAPRLALPLLVTKLTAAFSAVALVLVLERPNRKGRHAK